MTARQLAGLTASVATYPKHRKHLADEGAQRRRAARAYKRHVSLPAEQGERWRVQRYMKEAGFSSRRALTRPARALRGGPCSLRRTCGRCPAVLVCACPARSDGIHRISACRATTSAQNRGKGVPGSQADDLTTCFRPPPNNNPRCFLPVHHNLQTIHHPVVRCSTQFRKKGFRQAPLQCCEGHGGRQ